MQNILVISAIFAVLLFTFGCPSLEGGSSTPVVQLDQVKIIIKQIIPLPTGTIIEVSEPLVFNQSILPNISNIENRIYEQQPFLVEVEIKNEGGFRYENTTIAITYSPNTYEKLIPYDNNRNPLKQVEERYELDKEFLPKQNAVIYLAGESKPVVEGYGDSPLQFWITLYGANGESLQTQKGEIKIYRKQAETAIAINDTTS